jgi:acyl-CoA synthetase (AMP-forming)/AMP-acid ligase II
MSQWRLGTKIGTIWWLEIVNDCNVEIVDELGRECLPDQEGQIRIKLKEIDVLSYMENDEVNRRIFRDGYFYPGDMAVKRSDGRIRIVVNLQGAKVAVAPTERTCNDTLRPMKSVFLRTLMKRVGKS